MFKVKDYITVDKEILGGTPVFKGTRVPVESLFWHLEKGISISEFLDDFPSVTEEQAAAVIEISGRILNSKDIEKYMKLRVHTPLKCRTGKLFRSTFLQLA